MHRGRRWETEGEKEAKLEDQSRGFHFILRCPDPSPGICVCFAIRSFVGFILCSLVSMPCYVWLCCLLKCKLPVGKDLPSFHAFFFLGLEPSTV